MILKILGSGYSVTGINLIDTDNQYRKIITLADQSIIVEASWAEMCETVIIHSFAFEILYANTP